VNPNPEENQADAEVVLGQPAFERTIGELERQIAELERMASEHDLDVSDELGVLQTKLRDQREEIYRNLSAVDRVQLARHPKRP
jgi:acetyl-CoA carboxylase carboxyl transferase subunit alpha